MSDDKRLRDAGLVLPVILSAEDAAVHLHLKTLSAARRAIRSGRCGPYSRFGRRLLVRKESFLEALRAHEVNP